MTEVHAPQPTLPVEQPLSDAEWSFIAESPPKFFPENQDSNFGVKRKVFSDQIQIAQDQLDIIFAERFVMTSSIYLDEWERMVGLPQNPTGKTLQQRRDAVIARLAGGPFTRKLRKSIVESYLTTFTFGEPIKLLPPGVEMVVAGVPIYGEPGLVKDMYRIYEHIPSFSYTVQIDSDFTPDLTALYRDLKHFTPAGITVFLKADKNSPLNYEWETYNMLEPNAFWPLTETTGTVAQESSQMAKGYPTSVPPNGTYSGTYTLNHTALVTNDFSRKNPLFAGGRIQVPDHNSLDLGDNWCFECWFKRSITGVNGYLLSKGAGAYLVYIGGDQIRMAIAGGVELAKSSNFLNDTNIHYLVCQKAGANVKIYLDAIDRTSITTAGTCVNNSNALWICDDGFNSSPFQGNLGYVSLSQKFLTPSQVQQRYNTGRDILTG